MNLEQLESILEKIDVHCLGNRYQFLYGKSGGLLWVQATIYRPEGLQLYLKSTKTSLPDNITTQTVITTIHAACLELATQHIRHNFQYHGEPFHVAEPFNRF